MYKNVLTQVGYRYKMTTFLSVPEIDIPEKTAVSVGKFDGIHRGHMNLINKLLELKQPGIKTCLVMLYYPGIPEKKRVFTKDEEAFLLEKRGIDYLCYLPLDLSFMSMPAEEFTEEFLVKKLHTAFFVSGESFRFGKDRQGDASFLKKAGLKYAFQVITVRESGETAELSGTSGKISSTQIRNAVSEGKIKEASELLGHPYFISGTVKHGNALGRSLGFKTLNLYPEPIKLLPEYGVYAFLVYIEGTVYKAVGNVGIKPTVSDEAIPGVEIHLFSAAGDFYEKKVTAVPVSFLRKEKKFRNTDELKEALEKDSETAMDFFKCSNNYNSFLNNIY